MIAPLDLGRFGWSAAPLAARGRGRGNGDGHGAGRLSLATQRIHVADRANLAIIRADFHAGLAATAAENAGIRVHFDARGGLPTAGRPPRSGDLARAQQVHFQGNPISGSPDEDQPARSFCLAAANSSSLNTPALCNCASCCNCAVRSDPPAAGPARARGRRRGRLHVHSLRLRGRHGRRLVRVHLLLLVILLRVLLRLVMMNCARCPGNHGGRRRRSAPAALLVFASYDPPVVSGWLRHRLRRGAALDAAPKDGSRA